MKIIVTPMVAAAVTLLAGDALAQTAALSLAIPPSARANGMGKAYVALADDATAAWWNPAALGFLDQRAASVTHAQLVPDLADDVYHEFFAYAQPVRGWGTFAASLVYLTYGESEATGQSGEPLGTFNSFEIAPTVTYGTAIADQVGLGVGFKYIRVQLSPDLPHLPGAGRGSTVAADLGLLWKVPGNRVNLGLAVQNLGPDISFISDDRNDPIYRNLKAGFAVTPYSSEEVALTVVGDVNQLLVRGEIEDPDGSVRRRYSKPIYNGGAELAYFTKEFAIALRGGYEHDDEGSISDPTYGVGLGYKGIRLDIASIPQAEDKDSGEKLDRVQKFSLSASF